VQSQDFFFDGDDRTIGHTMMGNILTPTHLLLILGVALLVLGPKRLPEAGRGLGSAIRGFKDALSLTEDRDERRMMGSAAEREHQPELSTSANSAPSEHQETDAV
jgi:sec-independent protein translocase protein TatA